MPDEFRVQQATERDGIFVLNCPWHVSRESADAIKRRWQEAWQQGTKRAAPPLLILDGGASLQPLEEAELRELGLMRMP